MELSTIVILVLVGVVVYLVGTYNDLVSLKARIVASIQEIGNQLKRQVELIPNLEASVKGYLKHEKDILKMLSDARKMKDPSAKIVELLPKLQVIVESNPQIKGSDVVTNLMNELRDTSDKVMYSRRTLIDLTADYNIKLTVFPTNLISNIFGFKTEKGLETTEEEKKTPKISL